MDNGEEIPGLNESWSFLGAKAFEWISGFVVMILFNELAGKKAAMMMPMLIAVMVGSTLILAQFRRRFPDEERGVRNLLCTLCGFAPPGIPAPSSIQPLWSGAPARKLKEDSKFEQYGLKDIFPEQAEDEETNY